MRNIYEFEENYYLLASACKNSSEKNRLGKAYKVIQKDCNIQSLKESKFGLVCLEEAMLTAKTYKLISEIIPTYCTIVDCGCGAGLQQVFFNKHKGYIGIDSYSEFVEVSRNAKFIKGDVPEVLKDMETDPTYVGVSVLCGSVWPYIGDAMKDKFVKVVII